MTRDARPPQSRVATAACVAFAILLAGLGTIGWRWYSYVTAGASPYDEVGIEVNRRLPTADEIFDLFPTFYRAGRKTAAAT